MKKFICPALLISAIAFMFVACSAKRSADTDSRDFDGLEFTAIESRYAVNVVYKPSEGRTRVRLEADDDIIDRYEAKVHNGTLICTLRDGNRWGSNFRDSGTVTFYVYAPEVKSFSAAQASSITVSSALDVKGWLKAEVSSAGSISFDSVKAEGLDIEASSAGDVYIESGQFDDVDIDASSAADIDICDLQAGLVRVDASSAAKVSLSGRAKRVKLDASSSADIKASGLTASSGTAGASSCATIRCNVTDLSSTSYSNGSVSNKQAK